jgi:LPS-assembly protein
LTVPYYFNIAPNRDLTLYPRLISRRGLQLGAVGRYIGETEGGIYEGQTLIEYLPSDRKARAEYTARADDLHTLDKRPTTAG